MYLKKLRKIRYIKYRTTQPKIVNTYKKQGYKNDDTKSNKPINSIFTCIHYTNECDSFSNEALGISVHFAGSFACMNLGIQSKHE